MRQDGQGVTSVYSKYSKSDISYSLYKTGLPKSVLFWLNFYNGNREIDY